MLPEDPLPPVITTSHVATLHQLCGVEVKVGEALNCEVEDGKVLHLSQAALGESKNQGSESVPIFVNFNDQKLVVGTLSRENCAQIQFDLVFENQFELSHTSKNASVYFCGYKTSLPDEFPSDDELSESDEEDVQIAPNENGKVKLKNEVGKPGVVKANASKEDNSAAKTKVIKEGSVKAKPKEESVKAKPKEESVKAKTKEESVKAEPKASDDDDDDEDEDDEDDEDGEDDSDDEDMLEAMGDSDDDEDGSSDDEDEATPKKAAASGQKRPAGSAAKTPVPEKKAKVVSPAGGQKTGGDKKSAHIATPYPAKQTGKAPAKTPKSKQQSPKSTGSVSCKACSKSFNSENALQAHSKAKHSVGK